MITRGMIAAGLLYVLIMGLLWIGMFYVIAKDFCA